MSFLLGQWAMDKAAKTFSRASPHEEPSWLQMAICCKGDSAPQFWRMQ
jgi:hypothetical protein